MDVFQLATRLVTTGEEQTAEALKRVEGIGTSAANNITAAWSGVNFDPATRSAGAFADVSGNLAAQIRLATSAAGQQIQSVQNLGAALKAIDAGQLKAVEQEMVALQSRVNALQNLKLPDGKISGFASLAVAELGVLQRQLATTRATFVQMGGSITPAGQAIADVGGKSTKLASIFEKLQKVLFTVGASSVGLPGKFSKIGYALLSLGAGGAVVAAVTVGMALIGSAIQKAREKAEAESTRITQTIQTWQDRLNEITGAGRRQEIGDLAGEVDRLAEALAKAQEVVARQAASPLVGVQSDAAAEVARLQQELENAKRLLRLRRETVDSGPGSTAELDKRLQAIARLTAVDATRAEGLRQLRAEETNLTTQLAAGNLPVATRTRLTEQLTSVQNALRDATDKARAAYDRHVQTLLAGTAIERTRAESLAGLEAEEGRLTAQLERGNLPLDERVRLAGMLLQVQTALGQLPETEEQRAEAIGRVRQSYAEYLDTLERAVAFERTRPAAMDEIAAAIARTTVALRATNLTLAERLRLEEQLAGLRAAYNEGRAADQKRTLNARLKIDLQALNTGLAADLAIIEANTNAMLEQMGIRLSKAAQDAWAMVHEEMLAGPGDLLTGVVEGLAAGLTQRNAKAGDMILASLGGIFSRMGAAMIKAGVTLTGLWKAIASFGPQSGPALIAAGVVLAGLGKALGASAAGGGGGGGAGSGPSGPSFDGYRGNDERVVQIVVMPPAGQTTAPELTPAAPMNFTIIGPNDPVAQRAIFETVKAAQARGLK